jgi:predicted nucleic acid-binding protein
VSVAFDASILLPLLFPGVKGPIDPATNKPIEHCRERIDQLVSELDKSHTKVIIPTPALSEILVHAENAGPKYLEQLRQSRAFKLEPFDERAAAEVAMMIRSDLKKLGKKRGRQIQDTWAKVKFDRQIVAIAKVNGADALYTEDSGVRSFAEESGITVFGIADLPLPGSMAQMRLFAKEVTDKPLPE